MLFVNSIVSNNTLTRYRRYQKTAYTSRAMDLTQDIPKLKNGQRLINAQKLIIIGKLVEKLSEGYFSTYALSRQLKLSKDVINTYRPLADKLIADNTFDRNVIRNLQVKRTYQIIEQLMVDLKKTNKVGERALIYGSIYKFSSHLALITGLNVETHVNIDPTKLVIIRANQNKKKDRITDSDDLIEAATVKADNQLEGAGKD